MVDRIDRCGGCGASGLEPVLDLGVSPLANRLCSEAELSGPEPRYPLEVLRCDHCSLVQLSCVVPRDALFSRYVYFSSYSDTMLAHSRELALEVVASRGLGAQSLALGIASNDGYLLQYYRDAGVKVLGIEPASNVAEVARGRGIATRTAFFGRALGAELRAEGVAADVVHAHNVLAHVDDLPGFVHGIADVLAPGGLAVVEVPYVRDLVEEVEFDTIYHEHVYYFSATAIARLLEREGLVLADVERVAIHGGSLRVFAMHRGAAMSSRARTLLAEERLLGIDQAAFYRDFATRVVALREETVELLRDLRAKGARIAAYGASAKGSTLLNYFGIGSAEIDYVVDRSDAKQGLFTPGTHLPILAPETLLSDRPDYVLLLTWNFKDEILEQQRAYREAGGRFILPVPRPQIL